jgi:hypothetical protein
MNCQFCYTGRMGLLGNLSTAQIVEQASPAARPSPRRCPRLLLARCSPACSPACCRAHPQAPGP